MELEEILSNTWPIVRKAFYFPALPRPELTEESLPGMFRFDNLQISINPTYVTDFEKKNNISCEVLLDSMLRHEVTHFMRYPGSPLTILRMLNAVKNDVDEERAGRLRSLFNEAQTDLYLLTEMKNPDLPKIRKAIGVQKGDTAGRLLYGLFQEVSGQDYGIKFSKEEAAIVSELKKIDYLDKEIEIYSFKQFATLLKDLKLPEMKYGLMMPASGQGSGKGQDQQGQSDCSIKMYSRNQINQAIKSFALECKSPGDFEKVVKAALGGGKNPGDSEGEQAGKGKKKGKGGGQVGGPGIGTDRGMTLVAGSIYSAIAEGFSIPIQRRPMHKNGGLYPSSHEPFDVGSSMKDIDPFSSPGVLPGITKKWVRAFGEVHADNLAVPDSIIVIDNSPSMAWSGDPCNTLYPHIVGATAIANAYIENDSKVAVYSFGSEDIVLPFTANKESVHAELRRYSVGGGTTWTEKCLKKLLHDHEKEIDISFVSDFGISNLNSFVKSLLDIPKIHRLHLLYVSNGTFYDGTFKWAQEQFKDIPNLAVMPFSTYEHMRQVVMGELSKSII